MHIKRKKHKKVKKLFIKLTLVCIAIFILILGLDYLIRPSAITVAQTKAEIAATENINETITNYLNSSDDFNNLLTVQTDNSNKITYTNLNTLKANQLKANITSIAINSFNQDNKKNLSIPAGSLTSSVILSGIGPNVPIKYTLSGNVDSNFESKFESAGVNQTKHTIYLNLTMEVSVYILPYKTKTQIDTNIPIAETIIVGNVPNVYADLGNNFKTQNLN